MSVIITAAHVRSSLNDKLIVSRDEFILYLHCKSGYASCDFHD